MMSDIPPDLFILHPEREHFLTREWDSLPLWGTLLGVFVVATVMFVIWINYFWRFLDEIQLSRMDRQTTYGTVLERFATHNPRNGTTYWIAYSFDAKGNIYGRQDSVSQALYKSLQIDSPVQITYAIQNPAYFHLGGDAFDEDVANRVKVYLGGIVITALLIGGSQTPGWLHRRRFYHNGVVIFGEIIASSNMIERPRWYQYGQPSHKYIITIKYCFYSTAGRYIESQDVAMRNDLIGTKLPLEGTPIAVSYINDGDFMLV